MKVLKVLTTTAVVALTGFALTLAFADDATNTPPAAHHGPHGKGPMFGHILPPEIVEGLALTAEQKTALESLDEAFKKDAEKWRAENPIDEAAWKQARDSGDKEAMRKLHEKQQGLSEIRKSYVDKFRAALTDEQKTKLDKTLEELRSKPHGQPPISQHGKGPMFGHIESPKVIESLALTAEQKTALESLDEAFKKDAEKWHAENPIDEAALKLARENHDKEALHQFYEKQQGLSEIRKGYVQKFRALLTDEQKATLDKELEEGEMRSKHSHPGNTTTPPPAPKV